MAGINIIDHAGTDRTITGINVIDSAGTDRALVQINIIDAAGTDRIVWASAGGGGLAASVTPVSAFGTTRGTGSATTGTVSASASGGTAPYTYSWAVATYDNEIPPNATAPSSATTSFRQTNIGYQESYSAIFTVTVHDSSSGVVTQSVNVSWEDLSGGSGGRNLDTSI